jgi:hypothetical protein
MLLLLTRSLLATTFLVPLCPGQDPPGDRAAQVAAIQKEFNDAQTAFFKKYSAAKSDEEKQRLMAENPQPGPFIAKLWPLVDADAKDAAARDAMVWILQSGDGNDKDKARGLVLEHHLEAAEIGDVCNALVYEPKPQNLEFVTTVAVKSPHAAVRGKALWAKAQLQNQAVEAAARLNGDTMPAENRARYVEHLGEATVAWLKGIDTEKLAADSEALYEQIAKECGDVELWRGRSLADAAKGELFEMRNLAIGKVAPDIVGKDADGVEFKLSDYRGKVVVIDFWGFW